MNGAIRIHVDIRTQHILGLLPSCTAGVKAPPSLGGSGAGEAPHPDHQRTHSAEVPGQGVLMHHQRPRWCATQGLESRV